MNFEVVKQLVMYGRELEKHNKNFASHLLQMA